MDKPTTDASDRRGPAPSVAVPYIAQGLEATQIGKFHTKGGHGFAAEDANHFADWVRSLDAELVGKNNAVNGPDRVACGIRIQCKYCQTASESVAAAFDSAGGAYRYAGQLLEVPSEQYEDCVGLMRERIQSGRVPGVSDPEEAACIVRKGAVSYKQARNIARAGNVDSLVYDAKTQAVTTVGVCTVSCVVVFAQNVWRGESLKDATRAAVLAGVASGGTAFVVGVATAQALRTKTVAAGAVTMRRGVKAIARTGIGRRLVHRVAAGSLGKAISGAAAVNHVAKLLRTNVVTATVATVATSSPDAYRAAFERSISWSQLAKNTAVNGLGIAGGTGGWLAGAAAGASIGSAIPVVGTVAGGLVGGLVGSVGGSAASAIAAKAVADKMIEDDSVRLIAIVRTTAEELARDFCFNEQETTAAAESVKRTVTPQWLRAMYSKGTDEGALRFFAQSELEPHFEGISRRRARVLAPPAESLAEGLTSLSEQPEEAERLASPGTDLPT